ncbi:Tim44 domain-containing protein [Maribacter hydrothermalis]|uniref:Tim44-like domain-containing protein n=1 Tax=Maribacter hydrothermalis TaxID=1836467 RepID=A0A1B7ZEP5_9FLAO|nr:hypothetical protein [Maribacter hydrothermalis]APQ17529.1 hypothetical protein BTR34_09395 [Maribacter hydrothermalis]OBR42004.1 hypothetical protein A9200_01025 [Maribacter hydrothermalis]
MRKSHFILLVLIVTLVFFDIDPMYAGPGGTVVKAIFKTWWGKILMSTLAIILLPLTLYVYFREFFAVKKCKKQLLQLGQRNKDFSWLNLDKNVRNIFTRVYIAWNNQDLKEASSYISHWYWQNQQLVHLNEWKKNNLKNVCKVDGIKSVKPLYLEISENENLEGSRIAFLITANIMDYMINRDTNKIVQGSNKFDDEDKIWILEYTEGQWVLDDIQDGQLSLAFA